MLLLPPLADASALDQALAAGEVASVLMRLAPGDERTLVTSIKVAAAVTQPRDCALVVASDDRTVDLSLIAMRSGADGVHVSGAIDIGALRERLGPDRIIGAGGLGSRHDAMAAGEAGADYVLFGEPDARGGAPSVAEVAERASWWAEIFATPCIAVASKLDDCGTLAGTGAEFVALAPDIWIADPVAAVTRALAALSGSPSARVA